MQFRKMTNPNTALSCLVLFLLAVMTLTPGSMAGCGVQFDKMRKRRIEAIRGQILSKLGMTDLPNKNEPLPPNVVPREIEDMYNRTRDFVLQQARQKRLECEEPEESYYAQDIVTVYQRPAGSDSETNTGSIRRYKAIKRRKELSEFFYFKLDGQNLNPDAIVSASMRLYQVQIPGTALRGGRQQVELHQLSTPELEDGFPIKRLITAKALDNYGQGWQDFDVTSAVREWVRIPAMNRGIELTIPCTDNDGSSGPTTNSAGELKKLQVTFVGSPSTIHQSQTRGDHESDDVPIPQFSSAKNPHLVIMVRTASAQAKSQSSSHKRRKRALDADYCFRKNPTEANCCLRELFIDFRKDLGWNWIHAPSGYKANFCAGACPYLWSMDTQHATILSLYKTMNPGASSSPCCTPKELEPLTLMFYENGKYKYTQMSDMVLVSCKCS